MTLPLVFYQGLLRNYDRPLSPLSFKPRSPEMVKFKLSSSLVHIISCYGSFSAFDTCILFLYGFTHFLQTMFIYIQLTIFFFFADESSCKHLTVYFIGKLFFLQYILIGFPSSFSPPCPPNSTLFLFLSFQTTNKTVEE